MGVWLGPMEGGKGAGVSAHRGSGWWHSQDIRKYATHPLLAVRVSLADPSLCCQDWSWQVFVFAPAWQPKPLHWVLPSSPTSSVSTPPLHRSNPLRRTTVVGVPECSHHCSLRVLSRYHLLNQSFRGASQPSWAAVQPQHSNYTTHQSTPLAPSSCSVVLGLLTLAWKVPPCTSTPVNVQRLRQRQQQVSCCIQSAVQELLLASLLLSGCRKAGVPCVRDGRCYRMSGRQAGCP